jgi:hypothetical protein
VAQKAIQISPESKAYLAELEKRLGRKAIYKGLLTLFNREKNFAATEVQQLLRSRVRVRSGALTRSILARRELFQGVPAIRVGVLRGPSLKYAAAQEYGTQGKNPASPIRTIVPRRAKSLAMPVNTALKTSGVGRYPSPRQYPGGLHFIPFRRGIAKGALYPASEMKKMARDKAKSPERFSLRNYKAAYILLKRTDIRAHFFLRDGMQAYLPKLVAKIEQYLKGLFDARRSAS